MQRASDKYIVDCVFALVERLTAFEADSREKDRQIADLKNRNELLEEELRYNERLLAEVRDALEAASSLAPKAETVLELSQVPEAAPGHEESESSTQEATARATDVSAPLNRQCSTTGYALVFAILFRTLLRGHLERALPRSR